MRKMRNGSDTNEKNLNGEKLDFRLVDYHVHARFISSLKGKEGGELVSEYRLMIMASWSLDVSAFELLIKSKPWTYQLTSTSEEESHDMMF